MNKSIALWITSVFGQQLGQVIGIVLIAMLPIFELRGAIPVAYAFGFSWQSAIIIATIGNLLPIPFILFFLESIFKYMKKHNILNNFVAKLEEKAVAKSETVAKYQFWGLAIFVAIPLPGTGAWTGALIASVMKMDKKQAILSIAIGVLIAAVLVTFATYGLFGNLVKLG